MGLLRTFMASSSDTKLSRDEKAKSALRKTLVRDRKLQALGMRLLPVLRFLVILAGVISLLLWPTRFFGRNHYISENALQPGQVNTYWSDNDVFVTRQYLQRVQRWSDLSSEERAKALCTAFTEMGLPCSTQKYLYTNPATGEFQYGENAYAILQAPKTDGAESIVLSASWLSRHTEEARVVDASGNEIGTAVVRKPNTFGVALVLGMANYLQKFSMWSKDIVILISDEYDQGAQVFVDAYHNYKVTNDVWEGVPTVKAEALELVTGPIWAALNIDMPSEKFDAAGIFYEGADGHLTNLDYLNMASFIFKLKGITPVLHGSGFISVPEFYGSTHSQRVLNFLNVRLGELQAFSVKVWLYNYSMGWYNILNQLKRSVKSNYIYNNSGKKMQNVETQLDSWNGLGPEAVYGKYRIDALAVFCIPSAHGAHSLFALGRAVESIFRSLNNLLERFHQSFFLYIMTSIDTFTTVGNYLYGPVLIGAGLTLSGLYSWASSDPSQDVHFSLVTSGAIVVLSHLLGFLMDYVLFYKYLSFSLQGLLSFQSRDVIFAGLTLAIVLVVPPSIAYARRYAEATIQAKRNPLVSDFVNLLWAGLLSSVLATLNVGVGTACALAGVGCFIFSRSGPTLITILYPLKALLLLMCIASWQRRAWYFVVPLFWQSELL